MLAELGGSSGLWDLRNHARISRAERETIDRARGV
jgi:hypothetical protein